MASPDQEKPPPYSTKDRPVPTPGTIYPQLGSAASLDSDVARSDNRTLPDCGKKHSKQKVPVGETPDHLPPSDAESKIEFVRRTFSNLRKKLDEKEESIVSNLKKKASLNDTKAEDLCESRKNLQQSIDFMKGSMEKCPEMAPSMADSYAEMQAQRTRLDKRIHASKYLRWNVNECENAIENVCTVYEAEEIMESHMSKKELLWEKVRPGSERTQVLKPVGLAIEPTTDRIFVADAGNKRIQVFNCDGEHLSHFQISSIGTILLISFIGEYLFFIENNSRELCLTKMNPTNGDFIRRVITDHLKEFYTIPCRGNVYLIDVKRNDEQLITTCIYLNEHKLWTPMFTAHKLNNISNKTDKQIELHSPHIKDYTTALDVKIVGSSYELTQFYVLYKNAPFAVQVFNLSGEVVRAIIPLNLENGISQFLIDEENNIIISNVDRFSDANPETGAQNMYTNYAFSSDGVKKHKWTYRSENRDTFIQSFLKPFQKKQPVSSASNDVIQDAPVFAVCLNSKQNLVLLYNLEKTFMLRAF